MEGIGWSGCGCRGFGGAGRKRSVDDVFHRGQFLEFALLHLAVGIESEGFGEVLGAGEAESGNVVVAFEGGEAEVALGLEAAELGHGAEHFAEGAGVGPVDGGLKRGGCGIEHGIDAGIEFGFGEGAAAESPGGAGDFDGYGFFGGFGGGELFAPGLGEGGVFGLFGGADEIGYGEKSGGDGILRDSGFAFGGGRP